MEWRVTILLLTTVTVGYIRSEKDYLDVLHYLKELYRGDWTKGCGTEIKCDSPDNDKDVTPLPGNSTHGGYNCCYDCSGSCKDRPRCYEGWQCCRQVELQKEADDIIQTYDYLKVFTTCEPTLMHYLNSISKSDQKENIPVSYKMVSKCPLDYHDIEEIEKCSAQSSMLPILERIPYISTRTTYVYKNIHCVRCHNLLYNEIVPFSLSVHDRTESENRMKELSMITRFETVSDVIAFIAPINSSNHGYFGNVFITALPEHISNYSKLLPKPCFRDELDIMPVVTIDDKSNNARACELFNFPITVDYIDRYRTKTFKNLACAQIQPNTFRIKTESGSNFYYRSVQQPACTLEDYKDSRLIVNIKPALDHTNEINQLSKSLTTVKTFDNITNQHSNNTTDIDYTLDIEYLTPGGQKPCPNGFLKDSFQNRCRRILCPQRFYIYRGKCVPAYLETIRHSYLTTVKVSPSNTKLYINKSNVNSIRKQFLTIIWKITDLYTCHFDLFLKEFENKIEYILFKLVLLPYYDTVRYIDIVNRMSNIYSESLYRKHDTYGILLGLTFTSGSEIYTHTFRYGIGMAIDTLDGVKLTLFSAQYDQLFLCGNILLVSSQAYCLRVNLGPEEFTLINDTVVASTNVVLINATGNVIYPDNYELSNSGYVKVCVSDYLPKRGSKREPTNTIGEQIDVPQTENENELIDTYINIGLGVLAVLVMATIVYFRSSGNKCSQSHNT